MAEGLTINPDALPIDELRESAWQVFEPQYQARLATLAEEFAAAKSKGLGSDDLAQVAQAAATGRVATLLIEADRQIAGRLDGATGRVEVADLSHPQVDDLLDDLGELVGKMGGRVLVIPSERMPTTDGTGGNVPILSRQQSRRNTMQIQINTDHNIEGHEALADQVRGVVESALSRLSDHITRVEVHLSDENSAKKGGNDDMRCMMEARLEGRQPIAVTHRAATLDQAVDGAADKLTRLIESTLGRLRDQKSHRTDPPPPGPKLPEE